MANLCRTWGSTAAAKVKVPLTKSRKRKVDMRWAVFFYSNRKSDVVVWSIFYFWGSLCFKFFLTTFKFPDWMNSMLFSLSLFISFCCASQLISIFLGISGTDYIVFHVPLFKSVGATLPTVMETIKPHSFLTRLWRKILSRKYVRNSNHGWYFCIQVHECNVQGRCKDSIRSQISD